MFRGFLPGRASIQCSPDVATNARFVQMCVQAALSAIQISSIHFTGSTPEFHGLFVIRAHRSVHSGSHCANWSMAGPHAPRCRRASTAGDVDELLIGAVLPVSPVRKSSLERFSPRVVVAASLSRRADTPRR